MIALSSLKQDVYEAGVGIDITDATNGAKVISNTGVISLIEGANISITDLGEGNYEITSSAGSDVTAVSEILGGTGISVLNPTGPTATILNTGALGLLAGTNVSVSNSSGIWTVNAANPPITSITGGTGITITNGGGPTVSVANSGVISTVAGSGISITGTSTPTISNAGVISLTNGENTIAQSLGSGVWKIDATFPSYTQSTYTILTKTNNAEIVVPAGAQFAEVLVISAGGLVGANDTSNPPMTVYGGSGAGGTTCSTLRFPVRENQKFQYQYTTGYSRVNFTFQNYTTYTQMAYVPAAGDGEPGSNLGTGGQPGANPSLSTSFSWTTNKGSAGQTGFSSAPTTGGSPYMRPWIGPAAGTTQVDLGCGQTSSANTYGRGGLYVTFYLI